MLLRFENLPDEFYRLPFVDGSVPFEKINANLPYDWRSFYTQEIADMVYAWARKDFELYGYDRDSWKVTVEGLRRAGSAPTVHVVGAQETNYPWGFENRIIPALEAMGCTVISTDFRKRRNDLPWLLQQTADLLLVCKGESISPEMIQAAPCTTVLWYAEQVGTLDRVDPTAAQRRRELAYNAPAFDYVFSHDQANLEVFRQLGCRWVGWLPTAAVDPSIHHKLDLPKERDVLFVGSRTPRRAQILAELARRGIEVYAPEIWDAEKLNRLFNQARIVLNIHLSDLLNTETRLAEVLGSGSFLLSEELSSPELFRDGEHFVSWPAGDVDDLAAKIGYYLDHEEEREAIAAAGYSHAHNDGHTYEDRLRTLLASVPLIHKQRIWPSVELGAIHDIDGKPTDRLAEFYSAIEQQLTRDEHPSVPAIVSHIDSRENLSSPDS
ncbi:MAG: glycosyltransferase [Chloroflexi bacterium]|nr:glycosyltransferase [Chloroflexota bacterium]